MNTTFKNRISRIYHEEKDRLLIFIKSRISRMEDAEDILQDVFLSTLAGVSVTEPVENIAAWLYVSARNRIIDFYRKKREKPVSLNDSDTASLSLASLMTESRMNPENRLMTKVLAEALSEAIECLPESQRQVVVQQMIEGFTFQEISERTGDSINTLLARKRYAVQTLRKALKECRDWLQD
ncbi:RNA polymerase sigma factor [bacterium]|nr:RNA polymerase sigma factor [bacterium]